MSEGPPGPARKGLRGAPPVSAAPPPHPRRKRRRPAFSATRAVDRRENRSRGSGRMQSSLDRLPFEAGFAHRAKKKKRKRFARLGDGSTPPKFRAVLDVEPRGAAPPFKCVSVPRVRSERASPRRGHLGRGDIQAPYRVESPKVSPRAARLAPLRPLASSSVGLPDHFGGVRARRVREIGPERVFEGRCDREPAPPPRTSLPWPHMLAGLVRRTDRKAMLAAREDLRAGREKRGGPRSVKAPSLPGGIGAPPGRGSRQGRTSVSRSSPTGPNAAQRPDDGVAARGRDRLTCRSLRRRLPCRCPRTRSIPWSDRKITPARYGLGGAADSTRARRSSPRNP